MNAADIYSDEGRLEVARQVARWHLGDRYWADLLVGAFRDPERALVRLEAEKADPS